MVRIRAVVRRANIFIFCLLQFGGRENGRACLFLCLKFRESFIYIYSVKPGAQSLIDHWKVVLV